MKFDSRSEIQHIFLNGTLKGVLQAKSHEHKLQTKQQEIFTTHNNLTL